jgi:hypothetical protein
MKDKDGNTDVKGDNPLDNFSVEQNGKEVPLSEIYPTYEWVNDGGYENIGDWIEQAHLIACRPELEPPYSRSASGKGCIR